MRKSSSYIIVLVLLALVGVSIYLSLTKSKLSTVEEDARKFGFKDTAAITRIFMADKDKHQAIVERTKEGWVVNKKYPCRADAILNLLEAVKLVEVKMPVHKDALESVIKYMSFAAVKVELYAGDEKVRQYYVGHETPDSEGSYMLLSDPESGENYPQPYVCFIPGFQGFLQPRFIANENDWRDRIVMNFIPPQIKRITVEHTGVSKDSSFTIELQNANSFKVSSLAGKQIVFEDAKLRQYLVYFQNISYESLFTGTNKPLQDSLTRNQPFTVISVTDTRNETEIFKFYRKQPRTDIKPEHGVVFEYDPDRCFLNFENGREWALAQYFVFGKLLVNSSYFSPQISVKK